MSLPQESQARYFFEITFIIKILLIPLRSCLARERAHFKKSRSRIDTWGDWCDYPLIDFDTGSTASPVDSATVHACVTNSHLAVSQVFFGRSLFKRGADPFDFVDGEDTAAVLNITANSPFRIVEFKKKCGEWIIVARGRVVALCVMRDRFGSGLGHRTPTQ